MEGKASRCRYLWLVKGTHSGVLSMKVVLLVRFIKVPENGIGITDLVTHRCFEFHPNFYSKDVTKWNTFGYKKSPIFSPDLLIV
jgi:hypothetical protein